MKQDIISTAYQRLKLKTDQVIGDVHQLTISTGSEDMITLITDLRNRLTDPFMFVIVGEVKAGKSSFINALLDTGTDICAVAPSPMTDTIQQITYGDEVAIETISPYLKRVFQPVEILKDIAIVDTPGTNTIIEHHQEITERFIPAADLIVFVFEAKNPYRQSAWDFFNLIHEDWKKKIIFVLQQKDLLNEADLKINEQGVDQYARERKIEEPLIFSVSAKLEMEGEKSTSGYIGLRNYIKENITGGQAPILKLESSLITGSNFLERIFSALDLRAKQLETDRVFRAEIQETLQEQADRSHRQVNMLIENLINSYDQIWSDQREELSAGLSFFSLLKRSIRSIFSKKESLKGWLEGLAGTIEKNMQERLFYKLSGDVDDLADSIQNMVKFIDLKIQNTKTYFSNDMELFRDIADKRGNILKDLRNTFGKYIDDQDNFKNEKLFPGVKDVSPSLATGSGLAIIGLVLTAVTSGAVLDFTGGIVTTVGLLFAGITTGMNKRKVLKEFDLEMAKGKEKLRTNLGDKLNLYIEDIQSNIQGHFTRFDGYLKQEGEQIAAAKTQADKIGADIEVLNGEIQEALKKQK
jgi:tRNA U34 5-carboxymethylaminomethyl modifying GTPase MnmE/TrmE